MYPALIITNALVYRNVSCLRVSRHLLSSKTREPLSCDMVYVAYLTTRLL